MNDFDSDTIMRMNDQFQNQIAIYVIQHSSEKKDYPDITKLTIVILDLIVRSNKENRRIDEDLFTNATCSDILDLKVIAKKYYIKRTQKSESGIHDEFLFLDYPWLFSTEAKVEIIHQENNVTMHHHLLSVHSNENMNIASFMGLFGGLEDPFNLNVVVRRNHILNDSLKMLSTQSKNFKKKLKIRFEGEEGVDQGGVKKEFFHLLMKELFNPNYAMFETKFDVVDYKLG